ELQLVKLAVISAHSFGGGDLRIGNCVEKSDKRELMLAVVDLSAEEGGAGAVPLGFFQQFERIVCRARRSSQNSGYESGVVADQLFHRAWPVIRHFQEQRPPARGNTGERARDQIVDESPKIMWTRAAARVGIEHFKKMTKAFLLGLDAKIAIG